MKALKHYQHHPLAQAKAEEKVSMRQRYRVTTINWTYATAHGKTDYSRVHRNEYVFTMRNALKFITDLSVLRVAETVIRIEPAFGSDTRLD